MEQLRQHSGIEVTAVSSLYETEPQDVEDQPWFLNMVAAIRTDLSPEELLTVLQEIEAEAGRVRCDGSPGGPRTLDLDILLFANKVMETDRLTIPHPRMLARRFMLEPLLEIAPNLLVPGTRRALSSYLNQLNGQQLNCVGRLWAN